MSPRLTIGGQAVPHGVMLRAHVGWAVAVRRADGTIATRAVPAPATGRAPAWLARIGRLPLVRGLGAIALSLPLGLRAVRSAARLRAGASPARPPRRNRSRRLISGAGAAGIVVVLLVLVPEWLAGPGVGIAGRSITATWQLAALLVSLVVVGQFPTVRRLFAYHGAEHQVVAAYEFGGPVSAATARNFSRFHPRCGSTFVVVVLAIDGVIEAVAPWAVLRSVAVPVAIMVAYELQRRAAARIHRPWARAVVTPGLCLQRLTTRPADDGQLEVASAALAAVLELHQSPRARVPAGSAA